MGMANATGYFGDLGCDQGEDRHGAHVHMHDLIFPLPESSDQRPLVLQQLEIRRNGINARTKGLQFLLLGKGAFLSKVKVKLHLAAIQMAVIVHYRCFDAAAVHAVEHQSDA